MKTSVEPPVQEQELPPYVTDIHELNEMLDTGPIKPKKQGIIARIKKRVGGKKESGPEDVEKLTFQVLDRESVELIVNVLPFGVMFALTKDKKWLLEQKEIKILAVRADAVLEKYLPKIIGKYQEEFTFGALLTALFVGKMFSPSQKEVKEDESTEPES
jgi:hypothetical protein